MLQPLETKEEEIKRLKAILLATLDYQIDLLKKLPTQPSESIDYFHTVKTLVDEHAQKGNLSLIKKWLRDFAEWPIETKDFNYPKFIKEKTGYDFDVFQKFYDRCDKIIEKGKITNDGQFYDLQMLVNEISQAPVVHKEKIDIVNSLIREYELKKAKKAK